MASNPSALAITIPKGTNAIASVFIPIVTPPIENTNTTIGIRSILLFLNRRAILAIPPSIAPVFCIILKEPHTRKVKNTIPAEFFNPFTNAVKRLG